MSAPSGYATAMRRGAIAGLVFVVLVGAAIGITMLSGYRLPTQGRAASNRVLVIGALPDENGDLVAQVIADVDVSGTPVVRSVDPSSPVTVVGTGYGRLRDTYAFGGGGAVASGYARLTGSKPLPFIDLGPQALTTAIRATGGVELDLPAAMNVFDGERLFTFPQGALTAHAEEFRAILNGAAYLPAAQRSAVLEQAARQLTALTAAYPGGLAGALKAGTVESDLGEDGVRNFVTRLTQAR
ncbi:MAG: hypothetical protein LLG08_10565 [Actinomycetia bacterium]|nr:hypothetical protein [Actinomycetes bacterium]